MGHVASQPRNASRTRQFAAQAAAHKAGLSLREQMYIDALGNDAGYKALIQRFPDDLEAKAFAVWRIWHRLESGPTERNEAAERSSWPTRFWLSTHCTRFIMQSSTWSTRGITRLKV